MLIPYSLPPLLVLQDSISSHLAILSLHASRYYRNTPRHTISRRLAKLRYMPRPVALICLLTYHRFFNGVGLTLIASWFCVDWVLVKR